MTVASSCRCCATSAASVVLAAMLDSQVVCDSGVLLGCRISRVAVTNARRTGSCVRTASGIGMPASCSAMLPASGAKVTAIVGAVSGSGAAGGFPIPPAVGCAVPPIRADLPWLQSRRSDSRCRGQVGLGLGGWAGLLFRPARRGSAIGLRWKLLAATVSRSTTLSSPLAYRTVRSDNHDLHHWRRDRLLNPSNRPHWLDAVTIRDFDDVSTRPLMMTTWRNHDGSTSAKRASGRHIGTRSGS
jgi:hypothetical protein